MFKNILVPLDGSKLAEQAILTAQGLARAYNATIHLVRVISRHNEIEAVRPTGAFPTAGEAEYNLSVARQLTESQIAESNEYLEHIAFQLDRDGVVVQREVLEGAADEQVIEYARSNDIDLIVMASHGHGGIKRLLLGSVTDAVVRSGEVPVLVLPSQ